VKEDFESTWCKAAVVGNPALNNMDKMLQEADITPANLKRLGEGFKNWEQPYLVLLM
jgi:hypothetical protein